MLAGPRRRLVQLDDVQRALLAQGGYYAGTGILPFISRTAFAAVTGPKREWWLVETVGGLVTVIGGALISSALRPNTSAEVLGVAAGSAVTLAGIDVVYVAKGRIAPTYLVDAGTQLGLLAALAVSRRRSRTGSRRRDRAPVDRGGTVEACAER